VIGLEMGSVWRRLGSEVTILEALPFSWAPPTSRSPGKRGRSSPSRSEDRARRKITGVKAKKDVTVEYTDAEDKAQSAKFIGSSSRSAASPTRKT